MLDRNGKSGMEHLFNNILFFRNAHRLMSLVDFPRSPHLNANAVLDLCHLHAKSLLPSLVARRQVGPQTL